LKDIEITIPERNSLTGLLNQVKGSRVKFIGKNETVEGVVLGTETFVTVEQNVKKEIPHVNLFVNGCAMRALSLLEFTGMYGLYIS
jgi:hypothetical protein